MLSSVIFCIFVWLIIITISWFTASLIYSPSVINWMHPPFSFVLQCMTLMFHRQNIDRELNILILYFFLDFRVAFKQSWRVWPLRLVCVCVWPPRLSLSVSWQTEERLLMDSDGLSRAAPLLSNGKSGRWQFFCWQNEDFFKWKTSRYFFDKQEDFDGISRITLLPLPG